MAGYDAKFEIDPDPDLGPEADTAAALRAIVAVPANTRTQCARVLVFLGAAVLSRDAEMRDSARLGCYRAIRGVEEMRDILTGRLDPGQMHPEIPMLIDLALQEKPDLAKTFDRWLAIAGRGRLAMDAGKPVDPEDYDQMMFIGYTDFNPKLQEIETILARGAAATRTRLAESAERAQKRARDARGRIDAITRTVRMISLNARVEAARAGPAGRAFGVIAEEIKALSEQTEVANTEMTESLDHIMRSLRAL